MDRSFVCKESAQQGFIHFVEPNVTEVYNIK